MVTHLAAFMIAALFTLAAPASAVIIASGDGTGNTTPPPDDPGFAHLAQLDWLNGVYIGNGWVLTANHVGIRDAVLGGQVYEAVAGSRIRLSNPTGGNAPDLILFRIARDPGLPELPIRSSPPPIGAEVLLVGQGRNRGASTRSCLPPRDGWLWAPSSQLRWGNNVVEQNGYDAQAGSTETRSFYTQFSKQQQTAHEAHAARGDSGGAAFVKNGAIWELAGTIFAITQCGDAALYGDFTFVADLSYYLDQIESIASVPACDDGLDQDGDGLVDYPDDPGCDDALDAFETSDALPCDDGLDNDGDGNADFPADNGCANPIWLPENPECSDGLDNDADGLVDWDGGGQGDPDPQCADTPWTNLERRSGCGLGFELAFLMPPLMAVHRRRRRR